MRFKVTAFHLIIIIVVEIVLISSLIVFLVLKKSKNNLDTSVPNINYLDNKLKNSRSLNYKDSVFFKFLKDGYNPHDYMKPTLFYSQPDIIKLPDDLIERSEFIATTYDLSFESCGKYPSHPQYGITFSGKKAVRGRTVAVDPQIIPLGSKLRIEFPEKYDYLNGWYIAEDTGRLVKGKIIDVFLGESAFYEMEEFGSKKVHVEVIYPK